MEQVAQGRLHRYVVVAILALLFAIGDGAAWAYPAAPAAPRAQLRDRSEGPQLVARRRRRRRRRRKPRRVRRRRTRRSPRKATAVPRRPEPRTPAVDSSPAPAANGALRRGARVEFDGRLVQGQTAKSGAIYLFARKRSELRSMVKERSNYRREILSTVYPREGSR